MLFFVYDQSYYIILFIDKIKFCSTLDKYHKKAYNLLK